MELEPSTNRFLNPSLILGGFVSGVAFSSLIFIHPLIAVLIFILGVVVWVGEKFINGEVGRESLALVLILLSFGLGSLRYAVKDFHESSLISGASLLGAVVSEPEDRENTRRFVLKTESEERVLVSTTLYHPVQYGDRVSASGTLRSPELIADEESGRVFNYPEYLAKDDIYSTLSFAEVEVLSSGHGNVVKSVLFKLKQSFVLRSQAILSEPHSSLLMGLIVAGRDALPADILESFRRAGVIHIVVLSGFNITLIAEFMRRVFQTLFIWIRFTRFPQAPALVSVLGIILFVVMTGAEATVVRAGLMALVVILAKFSSRPYSATRALLLAGVLMLIENPKILLFDPSFQLSFLATLGLIHLTPFLERIFKVVPKFFALRTILAQTIATQIAVLPLLIYSIGNVSLVSLPANILILPVVSVVMLLGFVAVLLAFWLPVVLSTLLVFPAYLLLSWIIFVSETLGGLPFAVVTTPPASFWVILLAYLGIGWVVIIWRFRVNPRF